MKLKAGIFFLVLLILPVFYIPAQTTPPLPNSSAVTTPVVDPIVFPQWAKDLRRWEIVAFGSYPFTMFAATFAMDMSRWATENKLDFSDAGRRYAPWPLKSAGAVEMTNKQYEMTMAIAAGMSVVIAIADFVIVQIKRHKAQRLAESLPEGTTIITRSPWPPAEDTAVEQEPIPGILDSPEP